MQRGRGVNGVPKRRVSRLNSKVPQHDGVSLDAVSFLVIVGGIQEFPGQVGPLSTHPFSIQTANLHQLLLQGQHSSCVCALWTEESSESCNVAFIYSNNDNKMNLQSLKSKRLIKKCNKIGSALRS